MNHIKRNFQNPSQFENNRKIKFYSSNEVELDHKQIIVEGVRKDHSKYRIICDEGIKDLIIQLNNQSYRTLWSCEGTPGTPYVSVSTYKLSNKKINELNDFINQYWKDFYYIEKIQDDEHISFHGYLTKEKWDKHIQRVKELEKQFL